MSTDIVLPAVRARGEKLAVGSAHRGDTTWQRHDALSSSLTPQQGWFLLNLLSLGALYVTPTAL